MFSKKMVAIIVAIAFLMGSSCLAKKPDDVENQKSKEKKVIPYGLQKKVQSGKELPPGWQKKIVKGEVVDEQILKNAKVLDTQYPIIKGTKVYEVGEKIFRLQNATKEILEILK